MKRKIVGIFVITLLIAIIVLPVMGGMNEVKVFNESNSIVPISEVWNKTYGGTHWEIPLAGVQQIEGGYYISGMTESYGAGSRDVWIIKTNDDGNEVWDKIFGRVRCDCGWSVIPTSNGGCIVGSHGRWSPDWDADGWIIKVDNDGNEEWTERFGDSEEEYFLSIQEVADGYILAGSTESYGAGDWDLWLMKTDYNGSEIWNKTYGDTDLDGGYSVKQTTDGGFIIVGSTNSYGAGNSDIWLIKTDNEGNKEWEKVYGGTEDDRGKTVYQTTDEGYIIAGNTKSFGGNGETWLIKVNSNGEEEWNTLLGGCRSVFGAVWDVWGGTTTLYPTTDGGYIVTGTEKLTSENYDVWLTKVDSEGNILWRDLFGGSSVDEAWGVQQTIDGGYIVIGATKSYGAGNYDIWLVKFVSFENQPPNKPDIDGSTSGKAGEEQGYILSSTDQDGDDVIYVIDWGDEPGQEEFGPYPSGIEQTFYHTWSEKGEYTIRAKARDIKGAESEWSDPLVVSMPKIKTINTPFLTFLENHPHLFPILRQILGLK